MRCVNTKPTICGLCIHNLGCVYILYQTQIFDELCYQLRPQIFSEPRNISKTKQNVFYDSREDSNIMNYEQNTI